MFLILLYIFNMNEKYNHKEIEAKWQKVWHEAGLYKFSLDEKKKKFYIWNSGFIEQVLLSGG